MFCVQLHRCIFHPDPSMWILHHQHLHSDTTHCANGYAHFLDPSLLLELLWVSLLSSPSSRNSISPRCPTSRISLLSIYGCHRASHLSSSVYWNMHSSSVGLEENNR
ncbi:hypothetical protein TNCT_458421 [Trichonephila clavata]|uniref:Uncharacterized protein n=1 Tax=Trichonephila clavata TaxID=2740835 RepID=A0A8X6FRV9_TRICU|nr:hypothetical protein TNCT_458421 [Trichonephila clavata]